MRTTRFAIVSATAVAGLVVGFIVTDAIRTSTVDAAAPASTRAVASAEDVERLNDALARQSGAGDAEWFDRTLEEALPNFKISLDGDPGVRMFDATVEGRVLDVRPGTSHRDSVSGDDTIVRESLEFDDTNATWRTVILTVEVLNDFDPKTELSSKIEVALWLDGTTNPEVVRKGFQGQRIFAVLDEPGRFEPATAYPVARNGALIGVVKGDGSLSLPGLGEEERAYLDGVTTIAAVKEATSGPTVVLPVSTTEGYWERTG